MSLAFYDAASYDAGYRYADGVVLPTGTLFMARIRLPFLSLPVDELVDQVQIIVDAMDGAAAFASLQGEVTPIQTKLLALIAKRAAITQAEADAIQFAIDRDAMALELASLTNTLGSGVGSLANGNAAIMVDAGFQPVSARTPAPPLIGPENFTAKMGSLAGTMALRWKKVGRAPGYIVERATDPAGPWTQIGLPTRVTFTATGLVSGTKYYFRVAAFAADGPGPWSDIAEKMAP